MLSERTGYKVIGPLAERVQLLSWVIECAWRCLRLDSALVVAEFEDDATLETELTTHGWRCIPPQRKTLGPVTISSGPLIAQKVAYAPASTHAALGAVIGEIGHRRAWLLEDDQAEPFLIMRERLRLLEISDTQSEELRTCLRTAEPKLRRYAEPADQA